MKTVPTRHGLPNEINELENDKRLDWHLKIYLFYTIKL